MISVELSTTTIEMREEQSNTLEKYAQNLCFN